MLTLRVVGVGILLGLLTGCVFLSEDERNTLKNAIQNVKAYAAGPYQKTPPCPPPGSLQPHIPGQNGCYYLLTVTGSNAGHTRAKTAERALKKNQDQNTGEDLTYYPRQHEFEFHLEGPTSLSHGDYEFYGVPGSSSLSCGPCQPLKEERTRTSS
jgi:hypothetical protein